MNKEDLAVISESLKQQMQDDPQSLPIVEIPHSGNDTTFTKWIVLKRFK